MKLKFLCASHRAWLTNQPNQALLFCADSTETGWHLYGQKRLEEALAYIGSAFEAAEILLDSKVIKRVDSLEWLLQTLTGLTEILKKMGRVEDCSQVYQAGINRLQQEAACDALLSTPINLQVNRLQNELRNLNYSQRINANKTDALAPYCWSTVVH